MFPVALLSLFLASLTCELQGARLTKKQIATSENNASEETRRLRAFASLSRLFIANVNSIAASRSNLNHARTPTLQKHRMQAIYNGRPQVLYGHHILEHCPILKRAFASTEADFANLQYLEDLYSDLDRYTGHLENEELERIRLALEVAYLAHYGQRRRSGEPFISHPVEVARILADCDMDSTAIISGLLHDTVEDTELDFEDIGLLFGSEVKKIVQGETEVSQVPMLVRQEFNTESESIEKANPQTVQAENLRSLFVAMADDWRIVLVKLADRLHNMRTLEFMPRLKQQIKARETLEIYVPLAQRLGLWNFKTELSDLSFHYLYPEADAKITAYINNNNHTFQHAINQFKSQITISEDYVDAEITHRIKDKYSIWMKMSRRNCSIEEVKDIVAVRLVISGNENLEKDKLFCYVILSRLEASWRSLPNTFKDYIRDPKPNGYQSLHTTLLVDGQPLEVQIRTRAMHMVAEYGAAAHWNYKDASVSRAWLENIKAWQDKARNASEFMTSVRENLDRTSVFVRMQGKVLEFPSGTTARDIAERFSMGRTGRVLINGKFQGFTRRLRNNDEISFQRDEPLNTRGKTIARSLNDGLNDALSYFESTIGVATEAENVQMGQKVWGDWTRCSECLPLEGDELIGVEARVKTVHRSDCSCRKLEKQRSQFGVRVSPGQQFLQYTLSGIGQRLPAKFVVFGRDRCGILADVWQTLSNMGADVMEIDPEVLAVGGDTALEVTAQVQSAKELSSLMNVVSEINGVTRCLRGSVAELSRELTPSGFWKMCRS